MMIYIGKPSESNRKLLETIWFHILEQQSKEAGYEVKTQKLATFLQTSDGTEKKGKKIIPFTTAMERIKILNLIKEVTDQYNENQKILLKEIKEDTEKWEDILSL